MDKSVILKEIKRVLGYKNDREFADFLGISKQTLSSWHQRNTFDIELLYAKCILVSPDFLFTGCGPILKQNVQGFHVDNALNSPQSLENDCKGKQNKSHLQENNIFNTNKIKSVAGNEKKGVPLIPLEAIAGLPKDDNIGIRFVDCEHYLVPEFITQGVEYMIRVNGSSMYPKYSSGDILACRRVTDVLFFQWGKIYVIDSSQGVLVKRIFEDIERPDNIILVSDNKEKYHPFSFPKSDIRSLSIVVGVIRME